MIYHTWTVNGYGVRTNDIETTKERVENLLKLAPKFNEDIQSYFKETKIDEPDLEDYLEYDKDCYSGVAYLLQNVIKEVENIRLDIADDFNSYYYLLLCPSYAWAERTEEERRLDAEEKVDELLKKYIKILTEKEIAIDYRSVKNGG